MAKTFTRKGQLHYCSLTTSLVDDYAVRQQILSAKNTMPVLFFFMLIAKNEEVLKWMTDKKGDLKENRWLQALNFLISEDLFIAKKSEVADCLIERAVLQKYNKSRNIQTYMCKPIDPIIEKTLKTAICKSVVDF